MIRFIVPSVFLTTTFALVLPVQAAGSLTRTFVSSAGVDSNPCTITQPCATFAAAYAAVQANGVVAALDPGKFGPLTITTGVTINGNGWSAITAPASGSGITVTAGSGNVTLIGLEIDGAGAAYNGIVVNSAGRLTVTDCTVQNFILNGISPPTGNGILMQPTSGTLDFTITNTTALNNGVAGIAYEAPSGSPSANGVIDHVVANGNFDGIDVNAFNTSSGTTVVAISNTIVSNNALGSGINVAGGTAPVKVSVDNVSASGNGFGIQDNGTANILLGRSVITGNISGVMNSTAPNTFYTYKNNQINLNGTDGANTLNTTFVLQ
jgi:hypothetical protein